MLGMKRVLTVAALASTLATVGCGGGSSSKGGSASTAAAATSGSLTMSQARAEHTAVLLPSGEVFVAGGFDVTGAPMKSTVIISTTGVKAGPDLASPRVGHSATLLSSGEVLIAGGQSDKQGQQVLSSSEVFDPLTSTISAGPSLGSARSRHAAMNYFQGQSEYVLFAGGVDALPAAPRASVAYVSSAEVLDTATMTVTPIAAALTEAQAGAKVARLDSGDLLIVGGEGQNGPAVAQVFDVQAQTFAAVNAAVAARSGAAVASRGREVLVAGGNSLNGKESSSEVFDSTTQTFAQGVTLGEARSDATATVMTGGKIVLVGGRSATGASKAVEKVEGTALGQATVSAAQDLAQARYAHASVAMGADKVIVIGGYDQAGVPLASIETVDLSQPASTAPTTTATTPGTTPPTTTPGGTIPGTGSMPGGGTTPPPATGGTTTPPPATGGSTPPPASGGSGGGLSGLLGSLFGGGSGSGGSSILNTVLQAAIQALTATTSSGSGFSFSSFLSAFAQNLIQGLLGGGSSGGGSSGLSGLLSSLLGGLTGGSGSGSTGGGSGGLSGLLSGLLGGLFGGSGSGGSAGGSTGGSSSGGGLSGLLSSLFGGLFGGSGSGGGSTGGSTGGGSTSTGPAVTSVTPGQGPVGTVVTIETSRVTLGAGASVRVTINGTPMQLQPATLSGAGVLTVTGAVAPGSTTGTLVVELIPATGSPQPVAGPVFTVL